MMYRHLWVTESYLGLELLGRKVAMAVNHLPVDVSLPTSSQRGKVPLHEH